jgi:hypothetical protein
MFTIIPGMLAAVKIKSPEQGQEFQAHQLLSITQINDGELEVVKIKDMDLSRKHQEGIQVHASCNVNYWQNGNRGGMSVKLADIRPAKPV